MPAAPVTRVRGGSPAWIAASAAIVALVFTASNAPTPLYPHWQHELGFGSAGTASVFAAYSFGFAISLVVAGALADRFGRKVVLVPGVAIAIATSVVFIVAASVEMLVVARVCSGIATGVIASGGVAAVVDLGGLRRKLTATRAASIAVAVGAAVGPLQAASAIELRADPIASVFVLEAALLLLALGLALSLPLARPSGPATTPRLARHARAHVRRGAIAFAPGAATVSFVLGLGPSVLDGAGVARPSVIGIAASAMFLAAAAAQLLVRRSPPRTILRTGSTTTLAAMLALLAFVAGGGIAPFVVAAILTGAGMGLGQLGALSLVAEHVDADQRARATALVNVGAYVPAALLVIGAGVIADATSLQVAAAAFALVAGSLASWVLASSSRMR